MRTTFWLTALVLTGSLLARPALAAPVSEAEQVRSSLVRIWSTVQSPNYTEPWEPGNMSGGVGSGFIISGKRIVTNAHVVSNSRFLVINKEGGSNRYSARPKFIAHDCDLAILEVEDQSFFDGTAALDFGGIPEINSTVAAYGYPIGGQRMSVTRGVVSRIEFRTYAHSSLDQHLSIQVDAAINPGNSGGPVVQNGKVVGVAFQAFSGAVAQNTGYMIPTPVIKRFLDDIKDGKYDGYVELAAHHLNLLNPGYRRYLGMKPDDPGVLITDVMKVGSAAGKLQRGDILRSIDGHPITRTGKIQLNGSEVQLEEIVERKFHGDKVAMDVLRAGKPKKVELTLRGAWPYQIYSHKYNVRPRYVCFAGLVFQPLSRDFVSAHKIRDLELLYHFDSFIKKEIYLERPEIVVLSTILPDPVNRDITAYRQKIVDEINGVKIKSLKDAAKAFAKKTDEHIIKLYREGRPIVIEANKVAGARQRMKENYQVTQEQYLGE